MNDFRRNIFFGICGAALIAFIVSLAEWSHKQSVVNSDNRRILVERLESTPPCGGKYKVGHSFWNEGKTGGLTITRELDGVTRSASFKAFGDEPQPRPADPIPSFLNSCMTLCNC